MERVREVEERGCKVVMVGIGTESNAKEWMEANKAKFPFPLVLDREQSLYRELGMKRSVAGVWTVPILVDFAEQIVAGTLHIEHFDGDDLHMLAGDYITDASGKVLLAYHGKTSDDRPSVDMILATLDNTNV